MIKAPRRTRSAPLLAAGMALGCMTAPADAQDGLDLAAIYTADLAVTPSGGSDRRLRYLDNLELSLDADLDKLAGIAGASFHVTVLNNMGARPNDAAGSLQG